MKRLILSTLFISMLLTSKPISAAEDDKKPEQGTAAKEGKSHATAIAWAGVGVTLLVVTGVIVAIAINRDNDKTTSTSHN